MADPDDNGGDNGAGGAAPADGEPRQNNVLSLDQLIGAPIHALVEAETQAAWATARFVRGVGFEPGQSDDPSELGGLQMVRFRRRRQRADGSEEALDVEIPLLSLLPIPALQIRDAELDYTVKIVATEATGEQQREMLGHLPAAARSAAGAPATLRATFAREERTSQRRSVDMLLRMKVRIEQSDMPEGLARLLSLAAESVSQRPAPPSPPPSEPDATTPEGEEPA